MFWRLVTQMTILYCDIHSIDILISHQTLISFWLSPLTSFVSKRKKKERKKEKKKTPCSVGLVCYLFHEAGKSSGLSFKARSES